jgi:hypothetical protein
MSNQNDGGPAFPTPSRCNPQGLAEYSDGMTLRDWFAGHETLADLDRPEIIIGKELLVALAGPCPEKAYDQDPVAWVIWESNWRAKLKYIRADAMLKARGGQS